MKANGVRLLVAGGAGFIGSNFIRYILAAHDDWQVVNVDKLTYAGNLANLGDVEGDERYRFVRADIGDAKAVGEIVAEGEPDAIVNFAAETHVDRSIDDPGLFLRTNILGTQVLLDAARKNGVARFLQISTDEVYGSLGSWGKFSEDSPLRPNSPYAASKTAADMLLRAYFKTYGLPAIVTRCSNNYGPYQFAEKIIRFCWTLRKETQPVPVYGDGGNVRDWIHVDDHSRAVEAVLLGGRPGEGYNVGGGDEGANIEITKTLLAGVVGARGEVGRVPFLLRPVVPSEGPLLNPEPSTVALSRRRIYLALLVSWVVLTFLFTSLPNPGILLPFRYADMVAHFGFYGVMGFLCALWRRG